MNVVPLQEILTALESGARPAGGVSADSGEIASLGGEHLTGNGGFDFTSIKRIPRSFFESMRGGRIACRDILVVKDGATTGKTSFVREDFPFIEAAVNEHVFCVRVDQVKASPEYVFHFLRSPFGQKAIALDFRGATVGGISREFARKARLFLPPLPEQRRIAEILDKADALRAQRRAALAQLDALAQSLFLDMFGDPISNTEGWKTCRLEDVATTITDGTHKTPVYTQSGIEFLSAKDLKNGGIAWGTGKFISTQEHQELVRRCNPEIGDVLLAKSGSLGNVAIIDRSHQFSLFESLCLIKHDRNLIDAQFLVGLLRTPAMLAHLLGKNKGIAIKHLHLIDIRNLRITLPPIALQRAFAERITSVGNLRMAQRESLTEFDSVFASLQHRAFRGEL